MTAATADTVAADAGGIDLIERIKSVKGLLAAPVLIAAVAYGLYWLVNSKELSTVEERNLAWDVVRPQIFDHLYLTFWSTTFVILIAVPLGIVLTRPGYKRFSGPILAVATSGQALPAYGLVVLAFAALSVAVLFICECCARRHDEKPPTHRRVRMSSSSSGSSLPSPGVQPAGHGVGIALDGPGGSPMTLHSEQPNPAAVGRRSPRRPPPRQGTPPRRQPKRP